MTPLADAAPPPPPPSPPQPAPPPTTRRLTRDDLVAIGRGGRPWEFLPVAERALAVAPEDAGLLALAAANYARLGLRTAASERLGAVPAAVRADAGMRGLVEAIERLPEDQLAHDTLLAACAANLAVLRGRVTVEVASEIEGAFRGWMESLRRDEWFRCADGNVVRRSASATGVGVGWAWVRFADFAGLTNGAPLPGGDAPLTIDGVDPPWLLARALRETPRREDGFWRRLRLVEADPAALCDGLACVDLATELGQERLDVFVGRGAAAALAAALEERMATQIAGPTLMLPRPRPAVAAPVIAAASARQVARERALLATVAETYRGRDRAWWAERYRAAAEGRGRPLRVLFPTHRFSTFIRHSAADLAAALRGLGCEVEILMEPDDSSLLATVAYLETVRRFEPDLVVQINYTRQNLGGVVPANVPVVCWIQDAMPHLFDAGVGRGQTGLDFVMGHLHPELVRSFGYPTARRLATPVVVSEAKFHGGEVDAALARRLGCEIAYAGNQSETPEDCRDRLIAASAASAASVRAIGGLYERINGVCAAASTASMVTELERAVREEIAAAGGGEDAAVVTRAMNAWCRPMADRMLRHETLRWAGEAAEANGWRFRLFGRGWERHRSLRRYACGELAHGEELRASYRCAGVHLHASANGYLHQRVFECALSGGFPLYRFRRDDLAWIEAWVFRSLLGGGGGADGRSSAVPYLSWIGPKTTGYLTCDDGPAMEAAALMQRMGVPAPRYWTVRPEWAGDTSAYDGGLPMERWTAWLLGDMAETTFGSRAGLEAVVRRAIERPAWRRDVVEGIAGRVRCGLTYEALAGRMLGTIRGGLEGEG